MTKQMYSLCNMDTINFIFMSRLIMHLQNVRINKTIMNVMEKTCGGVTIDARGIAIPLPQDRRLLRTPDHQLSSQNAIVAEVLLEKCEEELMKDDILGNSTKLEIKKKIPSNAETMWLLIKKDEDDLPEIIIATHAQRKIWLKGFTSLKPHRWIMDEAIEIYLSILAARCTKKVYILDSFLTKNILERNRPVLSRQLLSKISFSAYEIIVGIWNVDDNHWKLLVLPSSLFILLIIYLKVI
ncbi:uncharacterized protein LOC144411696 [Styela clava]